MKIKLPARSQTRSPQAPADGELDNPFPMADDVISIDFLRSMHAGEQGGKVVRHHSELIFVRTHGQRREIVEKSAAEHQKSCDGLGRQYKSALRQLLSTKRTVHRPVPALTLPSGKRRWLSVWWGIVLMGMALLTWVNIA